MFEFPDALGRPIPPSSLSIHHITRHFSIALYEGSDEAGGTGASGGGGGGFFGGISSWLGGGAASSAGVGGGAGGEGGVTKGAPDDVSISDVVKPSAAGKQVTNNSGNGVQQENVDEPEFISGFIGNTAKFVDAAADQVGLFVLFPNGLVMTYLVPARTFIP